MCGCFRLFFLPIFVEINFYKNNTMTAIKPNNSHIIREITPLSDKDCFYIADRRKDRFVYPLHCHKEFELNFVEHVSGVKRIVGDSIETTSDYAWVLITSPDLEHCWAQGDCQSPEIREVTIQFSQHFFDSLINTNQFERVKVMLNKAQHGLCFPLPAIMKVYALIDTLFEKKGFYAVVSFLSLLYELSFFTDSARTLSSSSFAQIEVQANSRRVQKVQHYIYEHYQEEIRLNYLAEMVGMTSVAFSRFFKLRTGKSVSEYIIDIRLGYAIRLLVNSTMSVAEICYECGFNNLSNFNRIFKKEKNLSPKEFRESYKKSRILV